MILAPALLGSDVLGQEQPKITLEVKTVSVLATVRDRHGKIVPNLIEDDFLLDEDGRAPTINYFAREKDVSLRLGLLVDTSLSQRRVLEQERGASYAFLDNLLRPDKDVAAVIIARFHFFTVKVAGGPPAARDSADGHAGRKG